MTYPTTVMGTRMSTLVNIFGALDKTEIWAEEGGSTIWIAACSMSGYSHTKVSLNLTKSQRQELRRALNSADLHEEEQEFADEEDAPDTAPPEI